jgi:hypothetical protein
MRVRVAHASMQFGDSSKQHTHDIEKLFARAVERKQAWITGTEAGPGSGNMGEELIRIGEAAGYHVWVPEHETHKLEEGSRTDCWIAVRKDLVKKGTFKEEYIHVFPGGNRLAEMFPDLPKKKGGAKGVVYVEFDSTNEDLGHVTVIAGHYYTESRSHKSPWFEMNRQIAEVIGNLADEKAKGRGLVFYGGDQNMADNKNDQPQGDTFFGEDLTSTWDELQVWENTGHGCIDVIATHDKDARVSAVNTVALDDQEFFLHTDHFYVEAEIRVAPLKRKR